MLTTGDFTVRWQLSVMFQQTVSGSLGNRDQDEDDGFKAAIDVQLVASGSHRSARAVRTRERFAAGALAGDGKASTVLLKPAFAMCTTLSWVASSVKGGFAKS